MKNLILAIGWTMIFEYVAYLIADAIGLGPIAIHNSIQFFWFTVVFCFTVLFFKLALEQRA